MKLHQLTIALTAGMIFTTSVQADTDGDVTIRMMELNESTQEKITNVIPLPVKNRHTRTEQKQIANRTKTGNQDTSENNNNQQEQQRIRETEMEQERIQEAQEQRIETESQHNEMMQEQLIDKQNGDTIQGNREPAMETGASSRQ